MMRRLLTQTSVLVLAGSLTACSTLGSLLAPQVDPRPQENLENVQTLVQRVPGPSEPAGLNEQAVATAKDLVREYGQARPKIPPLPPNPASPTDWALWGVTTLIGLFTGGKTVARKLKERKAKKATATT